MREKRRKWRQILAVAVVLVAVLCGTGCERQSGEAERRDAGESGQQERERYTCGMHPWIVADEPGDCPICGMALTRVEPMPEAAPSAAPKAEEDFFADMEAGPAGDRKILHYRNPMNPAVTSPVPMKDEMGMDYVPVYADEVTGGGQIVDGRAPVRLTGESLTAAGVRTEAAVRATIDRTVRTVGIVLADETRVRHVHTKVDGWVETLHVNFQGQNVEKGTPILSLYSPTLLASQEEFLRARAMAGELAAGGDREGKRLGEQLVAAARRRLELFDVPADFIDELARSGVARREVTLNAPVAGFVTAKNIFEGQQVSPGVELFVVTDLSRVWIEADLYEYEARAVAIGQQARLTLPYEQGVALAGRVSYVNPFLSPESRTLKVRFEFDNPRFALKPDMYADVSLTLASAEGVTVPDSAIMDTGVRKLVFVETAANTFTPRPVRVGVRGAGRTQILAGVEAGEKVVVKANFLIDSESRLRGALIGGEEKGGADGHRQGH
ncbi:MAG: efflux RND transporter periplasmic adaptor subunit [Thermodesulfobacteriota bacterium]